MKSKCVICKKEFIDNYNSACAFNVRIFCNDCLDDRKKIIDYLSSRKMNCEYIYAFDVFKDNNDGFIYGVQELGDFPAYIEWFKTLEELEYNTRKNNLFIVNKAVFLYRHKRDHLLTSRKTTKRGNKENDKARKTKRK